MDSCLRALFVTDPMRDRDAIITAKGERTLGTCEWITSTEEYKSWEQSSSDHLWISGPPRMGKTYLSIYLSQHLEGLSRLQLNTDTVFFCCENTNESKSTAVNISDLPFTTRACVFIAILATRKYKLLLSLASFIIPFCWRWDLQPSLAAGQHVCGAHVTT